MSEVTFETGELPRCPYCELKHVTDAKTQSADPEREKRLGQLQTQIAAQLRIPVGDYEKVREAEHKLDDYMTTMIEMKQGLREKRHEIEDSAQNPRRKEPIRIEHGEKVWVEVFHEKEECAPSSFRLLQPNPEHFLTLCCDRGKYDEETARCTVPMIRQKMEHLHPYEMGLPIYLRE